MWDLPVLGIGPLSPALAGGVFTTEPPGEPSFSLFKIICYPFICWWISRLLLCPSYCKYCCSEHWGTGVFSVLVSSGYMPSSGIAGSYGSFIPSFKGISILFSIVVVSICIPTNKVRGFPIFHILSSIYCLYTFWWWPFWLVWDDDTSLWFWFAFL